MTRPWVRKAWLTMSLTLIFAYAVVPKAITGGNVFHWALAGLTIAVVLATTLLRPVWAKSAWVIMALAVTFLAAGDVISSASSYAGGTGRLPGTADWLNWIGYLLIAVTCVVLVATRKPGRDAASILDSAMVLLALGMALIEGLAQPLMMNESLDKSSRWALGIYLILVVIVGALATRLWFAADSRVNAAVRILPAAIFALLLGTVAYVTQYALGFQVDPDHIQSAGSLAFYVLVGMAVLDPSVENPPQANVSRSVVSRSRVLALSSICLMVPPIVIVLRGSDLNQTQNQVLLAGSILMILLVGMRANILLESHVKSLARERALKEAGVHLLAADSKQDVLAHLEYWINHLLAKTRKPLHLTPVAKKDPTENLEETSVEVISKDTRRRGRKAVPGGETLTLIGEENNWETTLNPGEVDEATKSSLDTLMSTASLALSRVELADQRIESKAQARAGLLLHNATDFICLVEEDGKISYSTDVATSLLGTNGLELVGTPWIHIIDPEYREIAQTLLDATKRGEESHIDVRVDKKDESENDSYFDVVATWLKEEKAWVITHHDITVRHHLQAQLAQAAFHDALTGLANRTLFRDRLGQALSASKRSNEPFAVMLIDLDDFKNVNDSLGHPAGDRMLAEIGQRLRMSLRAGDTAARLGGDEFAIILASCDNEEDAAKASNRLLETIKEHQMLDNTEVFPSASLGLVISHGGEANEDELTRNADIALYEAKQGGKNRIAIFHPSMHEQVMHRMRLTIDLRHALEKGEIGPFYQPVVDMVNNKLIGFEALARWNHPQLGEITPDEFIPLAEETGLILALGQNVLERALTDLARWDKANPEAGLRMSINVSVRQLNDPDAPRIIGETIRNSNINPKQVVLEITESTLMPGEGVSFTRLEEIADIGVKLYIDDFGTGYSSLRSLRVLPVKGMKLDKEFTQRLPGVTEEGVVKAIMDLATNLKLEGVVAEGVETLAQRDALISLGYTMGQGWLYGKALSTKEADKYVKDSELGAWPQTLGN